MSDNLSEIRNYLVEYYNDKENIISFILEKFNYVLSTLDLSENWKVFIERASILHLKQIIEKIKYYFGESKNQNTLERHLNIIDTKIKKNNKKNEKIRNENSEIINWKIQNRQKEFDELKNEYNLLCEKIKVMSHEKIIEVDVESKFKLNFRINQLKEESQKINKKMELILFELSRLKKQD